LFQFIKIYCLGCSGITDAVNGGPTGIDIVVAAYIPGGNIGIAGYRTEVFGRLRDDYERAAVGNFITEARYTSDIAAPGQGALGVALAYRGIALARDAADIIAVGALNMPVFRQVNAVPSSKLPQIPPRSFSDDEHAV
jgi:hypothetical protein